MIISTCSPHPMCTYRNKRTYSISTVLGDLCEPVKRKDVNTFRKSEWLSIKFLCVTLPHMSICTGIFIYIFFFKIDNNDTPAPIAVTTVLSPVTDVVKKLICLSPFFQK